MKIHMDEFRLERYGFGVRVEINEYAERTRLSVSMSGARNGTYTLLLFDGVEL